MARPGPKFKSKKINQCSICSDECCGFFRGKIVCTNCMNLIRINKNKTPFIIGMMKRKKILTWFINKYPEVLVSDEEERRKRLNKILNDLYDIDKYELVYEED